MCLWVTEHGGFVHEGSSTAWGSDKHCSGGKTMCKCLEVILPLTLPGTKPCCICSRSDMFLLSSYLECLICLCHRILAWLISATQIPVLGHPCPPQLLPQQPVQGSQEEDALSSVFPSRSAVVQVVGGGLFREHGPLGLPVSSQDQWELYWLTEPARKQGHA